eukprot:scpid54410/ scgid1968/ 
MYKRFFGSFFHDRIGHCRIVTSSRSYSNEKTFVTLEFSSPGHSRQAVEQFGNYKIHGCHTSVTFFKSRNAPAGPGGRGQFNNGFRGGRGGGGRGGRFPGNRGFGGGNQGQWNHQQQAGGMNRRGRSFGDLQGERMRGMSPNAAARFIEQRLAEKEKRQSGYKGETGDSYSSRNNERSASRSRSRSPDDDYNRRSSSREYRRSSSRDYASRSRSPSRSRYSHSLSPRRKRKSSWRSMSRSRSRSPVQRSPTPDHVLDQAVATDDDNDRHRSRHQHADDSESDSGRRRRNRKHRKHRHTKSEVADVVVPSEAYNVDEYAEEEALAEPRQEISPEEMVLELPMPSGNFPTVTQKLLDAKREGLEQEFNADVSTIVSVTNLLIGQDKSLQSGLQAAVRGCIRDISDRYVDEFETFTKANVPA